MNVLHVLDHSLPQQSGYAFRSHAIVTELARAGVDVRPLTGPKHGASALAVEHVDGMDYERAEFAEGARVDGPLGQLNTIRIARRAIKRRMAPGGVDLVHAHSPCLNGLAALGTGVPLVYEMRSSWEDAAVSVGTTTEGSVRYRVSKALETWVARRAAAVAVICEGLRTELVSRGIDAGKIFVVPNALPEAMFERPSAEAIADVRARFGLEDRRIVGFFGSFFEWEGVDQLVEVLGGVAESVPDVHLLLAGGGRQEQALRAMVGERGLESRVTFAGRIPHDEVRAFYGAADVMAFPRIRHRLTDMVTPLKPLEAMAQGTVVVASDVGGHRELVSDRETGWLFEAESRDALRDTLVRALSTVEANAAVIDAAARHVAASRRWARVVEQYLPVYERLTGQRIEGAAR